MQSAMDENTIINTLAREIATLKIHNNELQNQLSKKV